MATPEQRERLAQLILALAEARVSAEAAVEAIQAWTDIPWRERLMDTGWHLIYHFEADADIRTSDPKYNVANREELKRYAARLRAG